MIRPPVRPIGARIEAAALEGYLVVPTGRGRSAYFNAGFAREAFR
jgi:hypothetical protein